MPRKLHSNSRKALDDEDWDIAAPAKSKGAESGSLLRDDQSSVVSSAKHRVFSSALNEAADKLRVAPDLALAPSDHGESDRVQATVVQRDYHRCQALAIAPPRSGRSDLQQPGEPPPLPRGLPPPHGRDPPARPPRRDELALALLDGPPRWRRLSSGGANVRKIVLSPGTFYGGSYARECNFGRSPRVSARRGWGRRAGGKGGERQDVAGWYVSPSSESTCQACLPSGRRRRRPSSAAPPRGSR